MVSVRFFYILSVFSFLFLIWMIFHVVQVEKFCLSSSVVRSVVFLNQKQEVVGELPFCHIKEYVSFWQPLFINPNQKKILKRIRDLNRVKHLGLKDRDQKLRLIITEKDPQVLMQDTSQIIIGSQLIKVNGFLERAILQEWLKNQNAYFERDIFQLEVMTLLVWGYLQDQIIIGDPHKFSVNIDLSRHSNWSRWIMNHSDYCYSSWISLSYWESCRGTVEENSSGHRSVLSSRRSVERNALAPLIAGLIWNQYQLYNLKNKINFWRQWKNSWSDKVVLSRSLVSDLSNPSTLEEILKWINRVTHVYWDSFELLRKKQNNEKKEWIKNKIDILVEGEKIPHLVVDQITKFSKLNPEIIFIIKIGHRLFFEGMREVRLGIEKTPVQNRIFSVCKPLKYSYLKQVIEKKFMLVNFCFTESETQASKKESSIHWRPLIEGEWNHFISDNPQMKFILFYSPALKKSSMSSRDFQFSYNELEQLSKNLQWKQRQWEDRLGAFRPIGVTDAVLYYRF